MTFLHFSSAGLARLVWLEEASCWYPRRSRRFGGCVDDGRLEIHNRDACDFVEVVVSTCRDTDTSICA